MRKILMAAAMLLMCGAKAIAGDIHVAANGGDDNAAGTLQAPLKTVEQALKQAREWRRLKRAEAQDGIRIILHEGTYRQHKPLFIRPEDSGSVSSPTLICAAEGENAVISGGVQVTGWTKGCDDKRIARQLRGKIWTAEAPRCGNKIVYTRQMWVDGCKALRASQFAEGVMERMKDFSVENRSITIPTPKTDLTDAGQLEMMVHQRWAIAILRVKTMTNDGNGNTIVTFHEPESQLEFAHPWPQPVINGEKGSSSFVLSNAPQLLDQPGEWYQDYPSGRIYYYPQEGENPNEKEINIPLLETLLTVEGSRERPVSNISFSGLTFAHAAWTRPSAEGHVTLQGGFRLIDAYKLPIPGLPEKAELENQAWIARPEAAITVSFASGINFYGCSFENMGATGVDYIKAVSKSVVDRCHFNDIGGTAIQIGTFPDKGFETHVPYTPAVAQDICTDIKISNNRITDATNEDWGCVGIAAGYVSNTTIDNNEVCDVNYSGICVGWGWTALESGMKNNRITSNYVHHFAKQLYDAGGIYTLSNQPGSIITGNRIENLIDAPYATNNRAFYIYFDEATDGFTVEGNQCPNADFGYNKPGPNMLIRKNGPKQNATYREIK